MISPTGLIQRACESLIEGALFTELEFKLGGLFKGGFLEGGQFEDFKAVANQVMDGHERASTLLLRFSLINELT